MSQFNAGESKTAIVPMSNPTAKAFDYTAQLLMGTTLALMASVDFHLEAGQQKNIVLSVIMPGNPGTYPVYVNVLSGGVSIALYKATEDVTIVAIVAPFTYSGEFLELRSLKEIHPDASAISCYVVYHCTIINNGSQTMTRAVSFKEQTNYQGSWWGITDIRTFNVNLNPGQSYSFVYDMRLSALDNYGPVHYSGYLWTFWLQDDAGGKSVVLQSA